MNETAKALQGIEGLLEDFLSAFVSGNAAFRHSYRDLRRRRKRQRPGKHTREQWQALKEHYNFTCLCCHRPEPEIKLTKDHVDPHGSNDITNIQPLCDDCNDIKGDRVIDYRPKAAVI